MRAGGALAARFAGGYGRSVPPILCGNRLLKFAFPKHSQENQLLLLDRDPAVGTNGAEDTTNARGEL